MWYAWLKNGEVFVTDDTNKVDQSEDADWQSGSDRDSAVRELERVILSEQRVRTALYEKAIKEALELKRKLQALDTDLSTVTKWLEDKP